MPARVYGTPAHYGIKRRNRYRRLATQYAGIAGLLTAAPVWVVLAAGAPAVWLLLLLPALAVSTPLARIAAKHWGMAGRYARGADAERQVVRLARQCAGVDAVFCGVQPGRRSGSREDIDVLLVMTSGLVLLCEVKHVAGGEVDWDGSNLVTASGRIIPGAPNPVDQVLRQRGLLLSAADLDPACAKTMVVCSGSTSETFTVGPVLVTALRHLPHVLSAAGRRTVGGSAEAARALRRIS